MLWHERLWRAERQPVLFTIPAALGPAANNAAAEPAEGGGSRQDGRAEPRRRRLHLTHGEGCVFECVLPDELAAGDSCAATVPSLWRGRAQEGAVRDPTKMDYIPTRWP